MALLRKCLLLYGYVLQVHLSTGRDMERKKERTHRVVTFHNSIPTFIRSYPSWRSGEILPCNVQRYAVLNDFTSLWANIVAAAAAGASEMDPFLYDDMVWYVSPAYKHRRTPTAAAHTLKNKYSKVQHRVPERVKETASRKHGSSSSNKQCEIGNKD